VDIPFVVSLVLRDRLTGEDDETLARYQTQGSEGLATLVNLISTEDRVRSGAAYVKVEVGVLTGAAHTASIRFTPA
jgi:hypothetical protein